MDYSNPLEPFIRFLIHYVLPLFLLCITVAIIWEWFQRRCPSCKEQWARKLINRVELKEELIIKDEVQGSGQRDKDGREVTVDVRVPYMRTHFRNYWICGKCGYDGWTPTDFYKDRKA